MVDDQQLLFEETEEGPKAEGSEATVQAIAAAMAGRDFSKEIEQIAKMTEVVSRAVADSQSIKEEFTELFTQMEDITQKLENMD